MSAYSSSAMIEAPSAEPIAGNYFVAAYPPFSVWKPEQIPAFHNALEQPGSHAVLGLYIHIPFCPKKCDYCYYLSYTDRSSAVTQRYLDAVVNEFRMYAWHPAVKGRPISFAYFGGGTPSMLTPDQVRFLGKSLRAELDWNATEEVTFECAPRSVRHELLEALLEIGVTRVSMGVQSFSDELLKLNGRVHLSADVCRAYNALREAGLQSINLDLMVGMIGETPEIWQESIRRVLELAPESVTIYQTEMPYNTQLYRDWKSGSLSAEPVSWEIKRMRVIHGFDALKRAGYTVVSAYNAVKNPKGHPFKYQERLWRGEDMLGLGVASFGYFDNIHFQNEGTLEEYLAAIEEKRIPVKRAYQLSDFDQLVREFVLQLKFGEVDGRYFQNKFGVNISEIFSAPLEDLMREGFLTYSKSGVYLTRAGLVRVDRLAPHFYAKEFQKLRYT